MNEHKPEAYMKTTKEMTILLVSAAAVIFVGCVATSVYPFYGEKDVVFEPALLGHWTKPQHPEERWTFERDNRNGYRVACVSTDSTNTGQAHSFKLGGQMFLDLSAPTWKEDIQPEPVPSHILTRVTQVRPALKMSDLSYDWLKELLATNPAAIRHLVIRTGDKPEDRRVVLTADTAELQRFVLSHLKTERAWKESLELQPAK
jgi:hypothetical protein